jgi:WD40 repeat protein
MQTGQRVHNTMLPKWCKGSAYKFVSTLRSALESDIVSRHLHNWIDLIFGYKQRGKDTEKYLNTFFYMTYEDAVDIEKVTDPSTKLSMEAQAVHFGQCPSQLFLKPHPQRYSKESLFNSKIIADPLADIRAYRPTNKKDAKDVFDKHNFNVYNLSNRALLKLKIVNEGKIIGLRRDGTLTYYRWWNSNMNANLPPFNCGIEKEKAIQMEKYKNEPHIDNIDRSVSLSAYPLVFLNLGKIIVVGGCWDGRLTMYATDTDNVIDVYTHHADTVTSIAADNKENFLITGSKSGECILWKISPEHNKLTVKFHFYDHDDMITSFYISNDLRLFASASLDGKINLYNFIIGQLVRTIHHPVNMPIHSVVLTSSPLPAIVFFSNEDRVLYSYSINGRLLESLSDDSIHITSPTILKDLNFLEVLIYGNEKGEVYIRELPFLNIRKKFSVSLGSPVLSILLSKDRKFLLCGCGDGEIAVLSDPNTTILTNVAIKDTAATTTSRENMPTTNRDSSSGSMIISSTSQNTLKTSDSGRP